MVRVGRREAELLEDPAHVLLDGALGSGPTSALAPSGSTHQYVQYVSAQPVTAHTTAATIANPKPISDTIAIQPRSLHVCRSAAATFSSAMNPGREGRR
jgi:hypothetical protein